MNDELITNVINNDIVETALYEHYKRKFADDIRNDLLNQKEVEIEGVGTLLTEQMRQGTKSKVVINNVKFKFKPTKALKKELKEIILKNGVTE